MLFVKVDLILGPVQPETDGSLGGAAVKVIDEQGLNLLGHGGLLPFTDLWRTSVNNPTPNQRTATPVHPAANAATSPDSIPMCSRHMALTRHCVRLCGVGRFPATAQGRGGERRLAAGRPPKAQRVSAGDALDATQAVLAAAQAGLVAAQARLDAAQTGLAAAQDGLDAARAGLAAAAPPGSLTKSQRVGFNAVLLFLCWLSRSASPATWFGWDSREAAIHYYVFGWLV